MVTTHAYTEPDAGKLKLRNTDESQNNDFYCASYVHNRRLPTQLIYPSEQNKGTRNGHHQTLGILQVSRTYKPQKINF